MEEKKYERIPEEETEELVEDVVETVEEQEQQLPKTEEDTEIFVDYRDDVRGWMKDNNTEMEYLEEAIEGLLKAFRHSTDFYDGLRRIDAKTDIGRVFLELITRFMGQYEKADDTNFKNEVVEYIKINTEELGKMQERVNFLLKAYEYAEDFLYGLERIEPRNDIARAFRELLMKFVERGLSEE